MVFHLVRLGAAWDLVVGTRATDSEGPRSSPVTAMFQVNDFEQIDELSLHPRALRCEVKATHKYS